MLERKKRPSFVTAMPHLPQRVDGSANREVTALSRKARAGGDVGGHQPAVERGEEQAPGIVTPDRPVPPSDDTGIGSPSGSGFT